MSQSNNSSDRAASLVPDSDTIPGGAWLLPAFRERDAKLHCPSKRLQTTVGTACSDQFQSAPYRGGKPEGFKLDVSGFMFYDTSLTVQVLDFRFRHNLKH